MAGWVGKFVSFAPSGVGEGDIRFQDVWLRTFQERDAEGKFRMRMIRRADQATKSWPRGGDSFPLASSSVRDAFCVKLLVWIACAHSCG